MSASRKKSGRGIERVNKTPSTAKRTSLLKEHPILIKCLLAEFGLFIAALIADALPIGGLIPGFLLSLSILGLYYMIVLSPFADRHRLELLRQSLNRKSGCLILGIFSAFLAISFFLISQEKFIYYWDYSGYWARNILVGENLFSQPFRMLKQAFSSINTSEYNFFLPLLMALPTKLLGNGYVVYVLTACAMFALPTALMLALCAFSFCKNRGLQPLPLPAYFLAACACSCLIIPCLNGFPDVGALLCVASLLTMTVDWDWGRFQFRDSSLAALLLLLILIQRRYYGFFVIGFVVGWSVHAVVVWAINPQRRRLILRNYLLTMLYVGGVSLIALLAFFEGFFRMSVLGDYGTKYQAYAGASLFGEFQQALGFFGTGVCLIILAGAALLLFRAKKSGLLTAIPGPCMLFAMVIASAFSFFQVQAMGPQHQYVIAAPIILLLLIGISIIFQSVASQKFKVLSIGLISAFLLLNFLIPMSIIKWSSPLDPFLSKLHYTPKVRNDIPVLEQLYGRLQELTDRDQTFAYILASSSVLNNDIFYKLYYPESRPIRIPGHAHVDLRDGFAPTFFDAEYVVVCDPVQYHLKPSTQQVIGLLAEDLLNQTGIGPHYACMEEYLLDHNVKAKLYHRETPLTDSDYQDLAARYDRLYPDYPELFRDRILAQADRLPSK